MKTRRGKRSAGFTTVLWFFLFVQAISAQDVSDYISGIPADTDALAGLPITRVLQDGEGILVELDAEGIAVSLALLGRVDGPVLEAQLERLREELITEEDLKNNDRTVQVEQLLISVGAGGELFVELDLEILEVRLEERVFLDFAKRLTGPVSLKYRPGESSVPCRFPFKDIDITLARGTSFPGWDGVQQQLLAWARNGLDRNDQEVMGTILEIRRMSVEEIEEEKEIVTDTQPDRIHWGNLHLSTEGSIPELIVSRAEGVSIGIPSVMLQTLLCLEIFDLGGDRIFRPYTLWFGMGPFIDLRLYTLMNEEYSYLFQTVPSGMTVSAGFSGYVPRFEGYRLTGRAFGIGAEIQARVNITGMIGRIDDTRTALLPGEYVMDITPQAVFHLLPEWSRPLDITLGLPLKIFPNHNTDEWEFYSFGLSAGLRARFTLKKLYRLEERENPPADK